MSGLSRRRFLTITAALGAAGIGGLALPARSDSRVVWSGVALGAKARIFVDTGDRDEASGLVAACVAEIDRLEGLFSLYRPDSEINRLNDKGRYEAPSGDFLQILSLAGAVHQASGGAFDPTIQPLWAALAGAKMDCRSIGFEHVRYGPQAVSFDRPGMALTLNGIAQGYVTDRIATLFAAAGLRHVLVDIGELRALGGRRDGTGWPVRIAGSDRVVSLGDRALATSATHGTTIDRAGTVGHILDPRTGRPVVADRQVTVSAPTAALADALSTAVCILPGDEIEGLVGAFDGARIEARAGFGVPALRGVNSGSR